MAVCMDSWVGGIRMTHLKLWLATPDGSHCVINEMDSCVVGQLEEARVSVRLNKFIHVRPKQQVGASIYALAVADVSFILV